MVALAYCCFNRGIEAQKKPVSLSGVMDITAPRLEMLDHYRRFSHTYFLRFQKMLTDLLSAKGDAQAKNIL